MEEISNKTGRHSLIQAGSDLNQQTFDHDASWAFESVQSSILAGAGGITEFTVSEESDQLLSVVQEEECPESPSLLEDNNVLNVNLDAISDKDDDDDDDDEVFYDSMAYTPNGDTGAGQLSTNAEKKNEPMIFNFELPAAMNVQGQEISKTSNYQDYLQQPYLSTDYTASSEQPSSAVSSDSGVDGDWTGALLAQVAGDFANLQNHAQSTPRLDSYQSSTTNSYDGDASSDAYASRSLVLPVKTSSVKPRTHLTKKQLSYFDGQQSSNKENLRVAKYSRTLASISPSLQHSTCKVSEMKKLFDKKPDKSPHTRIPVSLKRLDRNVSGARGARSNSAPPNDRLYPRNSVSRSSNSITSSSRVGISSGSSIRSFGDCSKSSVRSHKSCAGVAKKSPGIRSPSYRTVDSFKLKRSPVGRPRKLSSTTSSRLTVRSNGSQRCSSCSDVPSSNEMSKDSLEPSSRSLSASDVSRNIKITRSMEQRVTLRKQRTPVQLAKKSGKKTPGLGKSVSKIMDRKSLGYVSSPIKPVKELRKIFTPERKARKLPVIVLIPNAN